MSKAREIRCFDYVNRGYDRVREVLSGDILAVFRAATTSASTRVESVAAELRASVGAIDVAKQIAIEVLGIEHLPGSTTAPPTTTLRIEWRAVDSPGLFPQMQAELAAYPLTGSETQLDFRGRYEPPFGALGTAVDRLAGRRIAEACVHRFVRDVAEHLRRTLPA